MGSRHPVTVSRSTAESLADSAHRTMSTGEPWAPSHAAIAELDAALTDAAEAAAWEPLRDSLLALQARDLELTTRGRGNLDQLLARMRDRFASAGMSIDDPVVVRTILLTVSASTEWAQDLQRRDMFTNHQVLAVKQAGHPVALAASRLVDPEALR